MARHLCSNGASRRSCRSMPSWVQLAGLAIEKSKNKKKNFNGLRLEPKRHRSDYVYSSDPTHRPVSFTRPAKFVNPQALCSNPYMHHICIYVHIQRIYVRIYTYMRAYMDICVHICAHIRIDAHIYAYYMCNKNGKSLLARMNFNSETLPLLWTRKSQ